MRRALFRRSVAHTRHVSARRPALAGPRDADGFEALMEAR